MKKLQLLLWLSAISVFIFSCEDEEVTSLVEIPDTFSELTVEQNKAQLEENGIQFITAMNDIQNTDAVTALSSLSDKFFAFDESEEFEASMGARLINAVAGLKETNSAEEVFTAMRLKGTVPEGEPTSPEEFFDIYAGIYNWDPQIEDWDYTAQGTAIVFNFPSDENVTSNDASLVIKDYQGVTVANPADPDYAGDMPTNLVVELKVDNVKVMEYTFKATYNNEGVPSSGESKLTITPFSFTVSITNNSEEVSVDYSLKKNTDNLVSFGAKANGNFTDEALSEATDPSDVVDEAGAYFQVMNIRVAGLIDVANLGPEVNALHEQELSDEQMMKKEAELLNKYVDLVVYYADSKQKIADTEFYAYMETDDYWGYEYWDYDLRMVFADGSKSTFDTYFEAGFEDFKTELEEVFGISTEPELL